MTRGWWTGWFVGLLVAAGIGLLIGPAPFIVNILLGIACCWIGGEIGKAVLA